MAGLYQFAIPVGRFSSFFFQKILARAGLFDLILPDFGRGLMLSASAANAFGISPLPFQESLLFGLLRSVRIRTPVRWIRDPPYWCSHTHKDKGCEATIIFGCYATLDNGFLPDASKDSYVVAIHLTRRKYQQVGFLLS
jgi:hypothetical protein